MVQILWVALFGDSERGLRKPGLDGEHCLSVFLGLSFRLSRKRENLGYMSNVLLSLLDRKSTL